MMLSNAAKLVSGIMLITVPTIEFGGSFLLRVLSGALPQLALSEFQKAMFRAGHAHAGVLVILGLVAQIFADDAKLPPKLLWAVRIGFVAAPLLVSGGFFGAGALNALIYLGAAILAASVILLGVGLIRARS